MERRLALLEWTDRICSKGRKDEGLAIADEMGAVLLDFFLA